MIEQVNRREDAHERALPRTRPTPSSPGVSQRMRLTRRERTAPELALRSELHRRGLRFRAQRPLSFDRRRKVDIAFPTERLAVFVDGCFWHSCPEHATFPRANAEWWTAKLARNVERDRDTDRRLTEEGWTVLRVWEHETAAVAADAVERTVRRLRRRGT
jgi:DNA mismatch endonuclease, patch repair protein